MKLFEVEKLSYYEPSKGYSLRLKEIKGEVKFSIIIGSSEAQSIALALEGIQTPRPMTHDIILDMLSSSDIKIDRVELYKFYKGTFYSKIHIKSLYMGVKMIDCRPSDAISVGLRYPCPIHVDMSVIQDIQNNQIQTDYSFNSIHEYNNKNLEPTISSKGHNIEILNRALDSAVIKENYEVAAKIRDKIKLIKNTK
tara:strand:- start:307 stop:894 length:588 start_codon:yes stop_codon:yes gene_type:complete